MEQISAGCQHFSHLKIKFLECTYTGVPGILQTTLKEQSFRSSNMLIQSQRKKSNWFFFWAGDTNSTQNSRYDFN